MSEIELSWKFRLRLTEVAAVSTEELDLDYFLLVLWVYGHYGANHYGISQCTLMRAGDRPAGPQLLPALVSALHRMVPVMLSPNHEGEVIPAPTDLRWGRAKGWNRGLRQGFKDLLVSISLFHSTCLLLVGSFPGVCNKAFLWRWKMQEIDSFTDFSRERTHVWGAKGRAVAEADAGLLEVLAGLLLPYMTQDLPRIKASLTDPPKSTDVVK